MRFQRNMHWYLLLFLGCVMVLFIYLLRRNKRETNRVPCQLIETPLPQFNAIRFFGAFQVLDRNGSDISQAFTPKVKQLFVLILLHTYKSTKGISSDALNHLIWPGLSRKNAGNNRGVTMNKLRQALIELDGITIENNHEHWTIAMAPSVFCDYCECIRFVKSGELIGHDQTFSRFYSLIERGSLLADMEFGWLDSFKGYIASEIIDTLLKFIELAGPANSPKLTIKLCDRIFQGDPFNEDALRFKTSALINLGLNTKAKYTYRTFSDNYEKNMDKTFHLSFSDVAR